MIDHGNIYHYNKPFFFFFTEEQRQFDESCTIFFFFLLIIYSNIDFIQVTRTISVGQYTVLLLCHNRLIKEGINYTHFELDDFIFKGLTS